MSGFVPAHNTPDKDIVMTPHSLAKEIIEHFKPSGVLLDPCRGEGAFYENFPKNSEKDWCELSEGRDFLSYEKQVDWIITNPPWSKIREFLSHGMKISQNIVYLITINHYTTKRRIKDMREAGWSIKEILCVPTPAKPWPQLGFQIAAVHSQRGYTGDCRFTFLEEEAGRLPL